MTVTAAAVAGPSQRARAATALQYEEEAIGRRGKLISSDLIFHIQRQRLLLLGGPSYSYRFL